MSVRIILKCQHPVSKWIDKGDGLWKICTDCGEVHR